MHILNILRPFSLFWCLNWLWHTKDVEHTAGLSSVSRAKTPAQQGTIDRECVRERENESENHWTATITGETIKHVVCFLSKRVDCERIVNRCRKENRKKMLDSVAELWLFFVPVYFNILLTIQFIFSCRTHIVFPFAGTTDSIVGHPYTNSGNTIEIRKKWKRRKINNKNDMWLKLLIGMGLF